MPLYKQFDISPQHKVAVWRMDESLEFFLSELELTDSDKLKLSTFKLDKRKKEWLASRLLLYKLLGFYPEISYDDNGKPMLCNGDADISISHTDGFVAVSVSDKPTALDIELCSARVEKIATRFVHADEEAYIEANNRTQYLTLLWSAKEALYKYYNVYGVIFKEQFFVYPFSLQKLGALSCEFKNEGYVNKLSLNFVIDDSYTLVYC